MLSNAICIAHGGDISSPSGGSNRILAFTRALERNGHQVHLVVPTPTNELPDYPSEVTIHTVPITAGGIRNQAVRAVMISKEAKRVSERYNARLQIEHASLAGVASMMGVSNFILDMHDLSYDSPLYTDLPLSSLWKNIIYRIEGRSVRSASQIIVVSNYMRKKLEREFNVAKSDIHVIPNGYFADEQRVDPVKQSVEINNRVTFLGSVHAKTDIKKIILVARELGDTEVYVVGDGPQREEIERAIEQYDLTNVVITGRLPYRRAMELTAKSQVVIAPVRADESTKCACPVKLLDYASLAKPIVVDEVTELSHIFGRHDAALTSDPEQPDRFVRNVQRLLKNPSLREELGYNARELSKEYTWHKQGEKLVDVYRQQIKTPLAT